LYKKKLSPLISFSDFAAGDAIDIYYNVFASNTTSKKNILQAVALKKKSNIFVKHDSYRKNMFYDMYEYVKERRFRHQVNRRRSKKFSITNETAKNLDRAHQYLNNMHVDQFKDIGFQQGHVYNSSYAFFKHNVAKLDNSEYSTYFKKTRRLYRINRRFNTRFYANRLMLKQVFLKKKDRQFTITRFVENFKPHKTLNLYKQTQLFLFMLLLSGHMFFLKADCLLFLKKHGVFVNGKLCTNPYKILKIGDVIQLPVVPTYYIFLKKYKTFYTYFYKKYQAKYHRMYAAKKQRYRTRSRYTPE
jgi:hypothetical protein